MRTYSELITLDSFRDRYEYLKLEGVIGRDTFGFDRWINQQFYRSKEWRDVRNYVITRDNSCDLGVEGFDIPEGELILIHHMNPIDVHDIINVTDYLLNPEFLITTIQNTHNAIHYGSYETLLPRLFVERYPNDTCPWRRW